MTVRASLALSLAILATTVALAGCNLPVSSKLPLCDAVGAQHVDDTQRLGPGRQLHLQTPAASPACVHYRLVYWASDESGGNVANDSANDLGAGSLDSGFTVRSGNGTGVLHAPAPVYDAKQREFVIEFDDHAGETAASSIYMIDIQASNTLPPGAVAVQVGATIRYEDAPK